MKAYRGTKPVNKIKNLLGPLKMCCCAVMWYCLVIVLQCLSFAVLSSLPFLLSSIMVLHWNLAAVELCSSARDMQSYGAAVLWCCSAMVLQSYGAAVLHICSFMVLQCYCASVL